MNKKIAGIICIGLILLVLQATPIIANQNDDTTTLEIMSIEGGLGGATVNVKNTGDIAATKISITTTVQGGIFGNIDITHECVGCDSCGSTLAPGAIKSENTVEAGFLIGFGPIEISTSTWASNAMKVTAEASGIAIGPLVIIQ